MHKLQSFRINHLQNLKHKSNIYTILSRIRSTTKFEILYFSSLYKIKFHHHFEILQIQRSYLEQSVKFEISVQLEILSSKIFPQNLPLRLQQYNSTYTLKFYALSLHVYNPKSDFLQGNFNFYVNKLHLNFFIFYFFCPISIV